MKTNALPLLALALTVATGFHAASPPAPVPAHRGDVSDVRVIRHMDQHPGAALLWEPYLVQWQGKHLVAA